MKHIEIPFQKVYRLMELTGEAFLKALKDQVKFYEFANGDSADCIEDVMRYAIKEDILFHENGDMIGGDG